MNKFWTAAVILFLSGWMVSACEKQQTVQAGSEGVTSRDYQPRAAPEPGVDVTKTPAEIKGELRSVDLPGKTMIVRVDNGMDQTFNWDDKTTVLGVPAAAEADKMKSKSRKMSETITNMTQLARRSGSDVSVQWKEDGDMKLATTINVTNPTSPKKLTRPRSHRR